MKTFYCLLCKHTWYPRLPKLPLRCPKCNSTAWNKSKIKQPLSYERVHELFDYHPDGYLIRKIKWYGYKIGSIPGCCSKSSKYYVINIDGIIYSLHLVIFLYHHGYLPENDIDHIDRSTLNNRIENLREVSKICNMRNKGVYKNSNSKVTGVRWVKTHKQWAARITINKHSVFLGYFRKFADAVRARYTKEVELKWSKCNSTSSAFLYLKENNLL